MKLLPSEVRMSLNNFFENMVTKLSSKDAIAAYNDYMQIIRSDGYIKYVNSCLLYYTTTHFRGIDSAITEGFAIQKNILDKLNALYQPDICIRPTNPMNTSIAQA